MWIVRVALQCPYTFIMLAMLIVLMGAFSIARTATDIFPNIKIPIAAVIWRYYGILPEEIASRIVLFSERTAQTTVNNVEHTESQSVVPQAGSTHPVDCGQLAHQRCSPCSTPGVTGRSPNRRMQLTMSRWPTIEASC